MVESSAMRLLCGTLAAAVIGSVTAADKPGVIEVTA